MKKRDRIPMIGPGTIESAIPEASTTVRATRLARPVSEESASWICAMPLPPSVGSRWSYSAVGGYSSADR